MKNLGWRSQTSSPRPKVTACQPGTSRSIRASAAVGKRRLPPPMRKLANSDQVGSWPTNKAVVALLGRERITSSTEAASVLYSAAVISIGHFHLPAAGPPLPSSWPGPPKMSQHGPVLARKQQESAPLPVPLRHPALSAGAHDPHDPHDHARQPCPNQTWHAEKAGGVWSLFSHRSRLQRRECVGFHVQLTTLSRGWRMLAPGRNPQPGMFRIDSIFILPTPLEDKQLNTAGV